MGKKSSKLKNEDLREIVKTTSFPAPQVQKWYKDFMRDCPTGFMTKLEFSKIYGQFFAAGDPSRFVDYVFNVFDVNKDGVITFKEFIRAISVATSGSMEDKLNWAFNLYDIDNDGYVSHSEMLDIVSAIYKLHGRHDLAEDDTPEKRVDLLFERLDMNKDGQLSREEFCRGFKNDPWITRALMGEVPQVQHVRNHLSSPKEG